MQNINIPYTLGKSKLWLRGDTLTDKSPAARTITNNGAVSIDTKSISFDGASYLSAAQSSDFDFGAGNFTVAFWFINPVANTTAKTIWSTVSTAAKGINIVIDVAVTANIRPHMSSDNSTWDICGSSSFQGMYTQNTWTHVALTRQGSNFYLFVNGGLASSFTSSAAIYPSSNLMTVGASKAAGGGYTFFPGKLSDLKVVKGLALWTKNFVPPTRLV